LSDVCQTLGTSPDNYPSARKGPNYGQCSLGRNADPAYGKFEFSQYQGGHVTAELRNLTFDEARALAQWIAGRNRPLGSRDIE